MFNAIDLKFKMLLTTIIILPTLFVGWSYSVHSTSGLDLVTATPNTSSQLCTASSELVDINQCATWSGTGGGALTTFIPFLLLVPEVAVTIVLYILLKRSQRLLLLPRMLLVAAAIFIAPVLAITVNKLLQPYGQQTLVSISKINEIYTVDKQPILGFGPEDMGMFVLFSLVPAVGLISGTFGMAVADHRKYAGMSKEKLFQ